MSTAPGSIKSRKPNVVELPRAIVGRAITKAKDVRSMAEQFIEEMMKPDIDEYGITMDF